MIERLDAVEEVDAARIDADELVIVLRGDLASILRFAAGKKNPGFLSEAGALNGLLSQVGCGDRI